jgi:hypothetical protein
VEVEHLEFLGLEEDLLEAKLLRFALILLIMCGLMELIYLREKIAN